jgi:transcription elongation GreA/GreB family factor
MTWYHYNKIGMKRNGSAAQDVEPLDITAAGLEHLHERLIRLKEALPDLALEAQRTAAYGDRSDNAEYKQAKGALRASHRKIFEIEQNLKRAVIISSGPDASGAIQLGSTVDLEIDGVEKTFHIVGPHETNPSEGRISHKSPLGVALIGHRKSETVIIPSANGSRSYLIRNVR